MSDRPPQAINSCHFPTKNEAANRPPLNDKDRILALGHLMLRLEQLHKLGLKSLQLASLIYHMTELLSHDQNNPEEDTELTNYCTAEGVRCVLAAHNVMLLMQTCIEEIRDYYRNNKISADKDVVDAAAETAEFISSLHKILDATITRISNLLTTTPKSIQKSDQSKYPEAFKSTALKAMETGRKSLKELEEATAEFNLICADITSWIESSALTTYEGGRLKIYCPQNL